MVIPRCRCKCLVVRRYPQFLLFQNLLENLGFRSDRPAARELVWPCFSHGCFFQCRASAALPLLAPLSPASFTSALLRLSTQEHSPGAKVENLCLFKKTGGGVRAFKHQPCLGSQGVLDGTMSRNRPTLVGSCAAARGRGKPGIQAPTLPQIIYSSVLQGSLEYPWPPMGSVHRRAVQRRAGDVDVPLPFHNINLSACTEPAHFA